MQEVPLILKSLIECLFLRKPGLRAHQDVQSALVLLDHLPSLLCSHSAQKSPDHPGRLLTPL